MRILLSLLVLFAVAGCSSGFDSTRVVVYADSARFYVRQNPVYDSRETVERLASEECAGRNGLAELEGELQPYPLDIRYAVYRCVPEETAG